jgi:hypothetical protein
VRSVLAVLDVTSVLVVLAVLDVSACQEGYGASGAEKASSYVNVGANTRFLIPSMVMMTSDLKKVSSTSLDRGKE